MGVGTVPFEVLLTVAVHDVASPTVTAPGEQETVARAAAAPTVTDAEFDDWAWAVSPPYVAVSVCVPDFTADGV